MAFAIKNWGKVSASANTKSTGFFTYKSDDTFEDIKAAGYFNAVRGQLKLGDAIYFYSNPDATSLFTYVATVEPDVTIG